jgi:beta-glucanase (GH16 family)
VFAKFLKSLLALSLASLTLSLGTSPAVSSELLNAPAINYADNSGVSFIATPAKWSTSSKATYQWLVNGKIVAGAKKLTFKASANQKNQSIQFKEVAGGKTAASVVGKIGQVIVNVVPRVSFTEVSNTFKITDPGSVSPKGSKVAYQWYKGSIDIAGAKSDTYTPATGDQGLELYLSAKYTFKGFKENSANSNEIKVPVIKRNYVQVWQEEFNLSEGSAPDPKIWSSENGDGTKTAAGAGWGNRERQYYISSLAKIDSDGKLHIDATTTGANEYNCYYKTPCEWISSKYITKGKVGFKYGRMEARIKGPVGAGTWGAFWMLGADIDERIWPWCGEIDVTELVGKDPLLNYGYLHGLLSGGNGGRGQTVAMPNGFADEYHTYAIDWFPDQIDWYVDGVLFGSQQKVDRDWVFDHEFYLIMNLAMGGNLGGPIKSDLKQARMSFDWIRFSTINGLGEVFNHS